MALTPQDFRDLLGENPGFFGVTFTKKNGESRRMNAMMGVKKTLRGGPSAYDPNEKGLVWVTDMVAYQTKPYGEKDVGRRSINVNTLSEVRARGKTWKVEDGQFVEQ